MRKFMKISTKPSAPARSFFDFYDFFKKTVKNYVDFFKKL